MKKVLKENKFLILTFILIFVFTLTFPYTGDDLAWSITELSVKSFSNLLKSNILNGRYLGNLLVIFMTKSIIIRGLIMSLTLTGILAIIKKYTKTSFSLVLLLMLFMPIPIFSQSVVWTSGFANYAISTLFLLMSLLELEKTYKSKSTTKDSIISFILLLSSSFFIENMTIFLLLFTLTLNIIYYIKNKKVNSSLLFAFAGSLLGTILMFIQPSYHSIIDGTDTYRTYGKGIGEIINKAIDNYVNKVHLYVAFANPILIALITTALIIYSKKNKEKYSIKQKRTHKVASVIMVLYVIYSSVSLIIPDVSLLTTSHIGYLNSIITGIYLIALIVDIVVLFYKNENFIKIIMPLIIITGLIAPLLVVNPIGPRNFFTVYVFEVILLIFILNETKIDYKKYQKIIYAILILIILGYTFIYSNVTLVTIRRNNYVKYISDSGAETEITVPAIPFDGFVHHGNITQVKYRMGVYTKKYNLRSDIELKYTTYENWKKIVKEQGYKIKP